MAFLRFYLLILTLLGLSIGGAYFVVEYTNVVSAETSEMMRLLLCVAFALPCVLAFVVVWIRALGSRSIIFSDVFTVGLSVLGLTPFLFATSFVSSKVESRQNEYLQATGLGVHLPEFARLPRIADPFGGREGGEAAIRGRVVVIDALRASISPAFFALPPELRAGSLAEVGTVIHVGIAHVNGQSFTRVRLIDSVTGFVVGNRMLPFVTGDQGIAEWVASLPRTPLASPAATQAAH